MEVKELFLSLSEAEKIFDLIREEITNNKNVQIFIEESLIDELDKNGSEHHVYTFNGMGCHHYNKDSDGFGGETWYGYYESHAFSTMISSASFISNCEGYYQLVEFPNRKKPSEYLHCCVGFEKLVLIHRLRRNT